MIVGRAICHRNGEKCFQKRGMKIDKITSWKRCAACNMTGYKGRIAIHEVLVMNDEMKRVIMNGDSLS